MQGAVCMPPHTFSSGYHTSDKINETNMDMTAEPTPITKEINQSDSGIFSATGNTTFPEGMDTSGRTHHSENDTDNRSDCSSPDRKYLCPICETMLTSQHEFTLHIRSHNNDTEAQHPDKGFTCRICFKVLSSSSSLDRHVLVHSGERPFTCKHCGDTFTTNGNMHRHMRTHKTDNYESDGSTDSNMSSGKSIEYNNNKIEKYENKRKLEDDSFKIERKRPHLDSDNIDRVKCPICDRDDFINVKSLEVHLEENHPDYPAKCHECKQTFPNNKILSAHRNTVHADENGKARNSVIGFKDLTFVDFTSEKFPHIARYECEKNMHKATAGLKFQCNKCSRAFPCDKSLDIHLKDCGTLDLSLGSENSLDKSRFSETEIRRTDFFSRLDLQDNSPEKLNPPIYEPPKKLQQRLLETMKSIDNSKDLADIQSIISMTTNESLLQHLKNKTTEIAQMIDSEKTEEEESQDVFAQEFRKMKLRGEFPCRLCTAVFPNLRALKGHNRTHLNSTNNGTYRCNMCPHSSIDKAALIRHMRTHNGDRPYECSLCNYAFTTKANCERHLRNRHAKSTREEVKKSIIYHPSEDPTNEDISKQMEMKKLNNSFNSIDSSDSTPEKIRSSTPKTIPSFDLHKLAPEILPTIPLNDFSAAMPLTAKLHGLKELNHKPYSNLNEIIHNESLKSLKEHRNNIIEPLSPYLPQPINFTPKFTSTSTPHKINKIQVKNLQTLKNIPEYDDYSEDEEEEMIEEPMDLVLDLSKKKPIIEEKKPIKIEEVPEDLTKKVESPVNMSEILAQQLLKNSPKIDHASFYASQLAFYRNSFPSLANMQNWPFPINPLLFQSMQPPLIPQDSQEMKERLQRLQLCGGGMMIDNFPERMKTFPPFPPAYPPYNNIKTEVKPEIKYKIPNQKHSEEMKPLSLNIESNYNENHKMKSPLLPPKPEMLQSPNSVKMVIKNGVLMPKQKQRRYRTERPFSCEHCSARFTLRSNMERHIKQQHPQYWSQRQRTAVGNPGRKPQLLPPTIKNSLCELSIPNYEVPKMQEFDEQSKDTTISEKIKYAILAQHLRAAQDPKHYQKDEDEEEEEEPALVIDENNLNAKHDYEHLNKSRMFEEKLKELREKQMRGEIKKIEDAQDLVPVSRLLDNASQQPFKDYFRREGEGEEPDVEGISEEEEEGLVASGSTSEGNSGTDENRSESDNPANQSTLKKKSAYSLAPNRVSCPYCSRKFPWTSSLRRHILTHTGQKPFKCSHCPLLFTTKSNCDRHLLRKHGNAATTITNENVSNNNNFMMRNVPERPFKCSSCPSSTFSTYPNLKKHMICKHGAQDDRQGYEAGSSEDEKNHSDQKSDWETQISHTTTKLTVASENQVQNSDLPFKCHLCDNSFGDRQDCLEHIKDKHSSEYDLLMSKNALDANASTPEEGVTHDDDDHEIRGKFPDYSNRKVICAFCMRRFWSAEDLRRHMRTHTGERPFSCDICRRRFTLKHSMLRHRKKHNVPFENDAGHSDEEVHMHHHTNDFVKENNNLISKLIERTDESDGNEGNDLISNLLGIRDRSIIEQMLTASADDAAKLLGVGSQE